MSNLNFSIRMTLLSFSHVTFNSILSDPALAYLFPHIPLEVPRISSDNSLSVGITIPSTRKIVLCRTPQLFGLCGDKNLLIFLHLHWIVCYSHGGCEGEKELWFQQLRKGRV